MKRIFIRRTAVLEAIVLLLVIVLPILSEKAEAAGLQRTIIRLDRMAISQPTTGEVCAQPQTTSAVNVDVQVTFPTGFTVNTTGSNWATSTTDILSGSTVWPGIGAATATALGQTVTWTYGSSQTLTAGTLYCFRWTNTAALSTPGSASGSLTGTVTTRTTAAATIDSGAYATAIVGANADQIAVSASVPATFTFALSANTDALGTLSTTTASSTGRTVTIGTNAASGWVAWVRSANAGLLSASTSATVATAGSVDNTPTDLASATGYVLDVDITTDSGTGTGTVSQASNFGAEYAGANATSGGALSQTFQPIAASSGTTDGDVLTLTERAKISAVQAAATDYADTLTVVAAGRF
jgi:hypothetical protein